MRIQTAPKTPEFTPIELNIIFDTEEELESFAAMCGPDGQNLVTSVEDLPIPEFDNIGMESVPAVELMNSDLYSNVNSADKILGYNPRYYNWKTKIDRIHGAFTTTLKDWVAPIDDAFLYSLFGDNLSTYKGVTWPFFKVNPNTLDDIFAVKVLLYSFPITVLSYYHGSILFL